MDHTEDTIAPELSHALVPPAPVGATSDAPSSVVELPMELKEFRKGRLVFRVPPAQAGPVCYQNCFMLCFRCIIVCRCAQTHVA